MIQKEGSTKSLSGFQNWALGPEKSPPFPKKIKRIPTTIEATPTITGPPAKRPTIEEPPRSEEPPENRRLGATFVDSDALLEMALGPPLVVMAIRR